MFKLNAKIFTDEEIVSDAKKYRALLRHQGEKKMALALKLELCFIIQREINSISERVNEFANRGLKNNHLINIDTQP